MADKAGLVNEAGRETDDAFQGNLADKPSAIIRVAVAVRDLVYDVLPGTVEVVWPRQGSVGWGTGAKKFTEQFAYLMAYKRHVTLGFYHGGDLPDPTGLLPEAGGKQVAGTLSMRSLKLHSVDDVKNPDLRVLIGEATQHKVPPPTARST